MDNMISVSGLQKSFGKKTVVDNVNFELKQGVILGLLGPNGAGKTTTLKMITNLCPKDKGEIVINGYSLAEHPREALLQVGAALDTPAFYNELTARENLSYVAKLYGNIPAARIAELIEFVGLGGQDTKRVRAYSLGMRQKKRGRRTCRYMLDMKHRQIALSACGQQVSGLEAGGFTAGKLHRAAGKVVILNINQE